MFINDEDLLIFKHEIDRLIDFVHKRAGSANGPCDVELKIIALKEKFEDITTGE